MYKRQMTYDADEEKVSSDKPLITNREDAVWIEWGARRMEQHKENRLWYTIRH